VVGKRKRVPRPSFAWAGILFEGRRNFVVCDDCPVRSLIY
jgi:hypothetical protein